MEKLTRVMKIERMRKAGINITYKADSKRVERKWLLEMTPIIEARKCKNRRRRQRKQLDKQAAIARCARKITRQYRKQKQPIGTQHNTRIYDEMSTEPISSAQLRQLMQHREQLLTTK